MVHRQEGGCTKIGVGGVPRRPSYFRRRCSGFSSWTGRPEPRQRRGRGRERPPLYRRWRGTAKWGGVAPVFMYPCRKAPRPARGPDDEQRRGGWFLLTGGGMSSWCGAGGTGRQCSPSMIPWPFSCIAARPISTGQSSPGSASRRPLSPQDAAPARAVSARRKATTCPLAPSR